MDRYDFMIPGNLDSRAEFANLTLKMIYQKRNGDLNACIQDLKDNNFLELLEEHVRNVYELEGNQIPLMALYRLREHGPENYGMSDGEYHEALGLTEEACHAYYQD